MTMLCILRLGVDGKVRIVRSYSDVDAAEHEDVHGCLIPRRKTGQSSCDT